MYAFAPTMYAFDETYTKALITRGRQHHSSILAFKKQLEKQRNLPEFGGGIVIWLSLLRRLLGCWLLMLYCRSHQMRTLQAQMRTLQAMSTQLFVWTNILSMVTNFGHVLSMKSSILVRQASDLLCCPSCAMEGNRQQHWWYEPALQQVLTAIICENYPVHHVLGNGSLCI